MMMRLKLLVLVAMMGVAMMSVVTEHAAADAVSNDGAQKAILVTGASSGIGLKITEYLSAAGHFVYAGARKQKDLDSLNAMENVQSIRLDVTIQSEIDAAVTTISEAGRGLYAVVNNAGVAIYRPVLETSDEDFHFQMDVNVYGPFRITKAFAPLVMAEEGRFTTIGSIAGTVTWPGLSAYSMTKHAMEAFNDAFAAEMAPQNVTVNIVEPGNYKSRISASLQQRAVDQLLAKGEELTEEQQALQREAMAKVCAKADLVITTAQLFGRKAPVIITKEIIANMKPGSIIVDLAVETGGNVEGSVLDEEVDINGVRILGLGNMPGRACENASQMYSANLGALVEHFWNDDDKVFELNLDDEIMQGCLVTHNGEIQNQMIKDLRNA